MTASLLGRLNSFAWRLPGLKQVRRSGPVNALFRLGYGPHWGRFATREEAVAFLRPSGRVTYDNEAIVPINLESFCQTHLFDWPVLFALEQMLSRGQLATVTDYGGHVGAKYRAYRRHLDFPDDLRWQVVEVPAMVREGRRRAAAEGLAALSFHEDASTTAPCDVLLCSGVLQYLDRDIADLVTALPARPRRIILNKVALVEGDGFYTLESFGIGRMPYRIMGRSQLERAREALGYEVVAQWDIPSRNHVIPSARRTDQITMIGESWELTRTSQA
jgi:putative methyltransferase (TIGR04325 family)